MALTASGEMERARAGGSLGDIEALARSAMFKGWGSGEKKTTEKEAYTWLKDAYVFAKNNKDHLDNPEIQELLAKKLAKLDVAGYFTPTYKPKPESQAIERDGMVVRGPGQGVTGDAEIDYVATVGALYDRFKTEHPDLHKPYSVETMGSAQPGGPQVPGTMRTDPVAPTQQSQFFAAPPQKYGEGDVIATPTISPQGKPGLQQYGKIEKTATPVADKPSFGSIHLDPKTGRWGQFGPDNKFVPITTAAELAAQARGNDSPDIPNSVYNNNLNNAIKDAVEGADQPGVMERVYNWFMGRDPKVFEEIIKPRLDTYNDYYRGSQGKKPSTPTKETTTPAPPKRKPLGSYFTAPKES